MSYTRDHQQKFTDLNYHITHSDQIRRKANGGNSILFSYPPHEEHRYIKKAKVIYADRAVLIDVSRILVRIIDEDEKGWASFRDYYRDFLETGSPHLVFRSDDPATDFFDLIIHNIEGASQKGKIPFLVRTGALYGTGIENVNIMEDKRVMALPHPLVIFYPSRIEDDNLYFLNFKPASKYRCILVA